MAADWLLVYGRLRRDLDNLKKREDAWDEDEVGQFVALLVLRKLYRKDHGFI